MVMAGSVACHNLLGLRYRPLTPLPPMHRNVTRHYYPAHWRSIAQYRYCHHSFYLALVDKGNTG